jgi:hypothetical protein
MEKRAVRLGVFWLASFGVILLSGCATKPAATEPVKKPSQTAPLDLHSFRNEFNQFMAASKDVEQETIWKNWHDMVEAKDSIFFEEIIGQSGSSPGWEMSYKAAFFKAWPFFRLYEDKIDQEFSRFPTLINENQTAFREVFTDFDIGRIPVYAVPSLLQFDGQGAEVDGKPVLAFGMDMIVLLREQPNIMPGIVWTSNSRVLYAHEMFHIYQNAKQQVTPELFKSEATMANIVWNEGLATYASGVVNPKASDSELLKDSELAQKCHWRGDELMQKFKAVSRLKFASPEGQQAFHEWFMLSSKDKNLIPRAGYCVGLLLARRMVQSGLKVEQMASWKFKEIPVHVEEFLNRPASSSEKK